MRAMMGKMIEQTLAEREKREVPAGKLGHQV
jgi:hypothetical protein